MNGDKSGSESISLVAHPAERGVSKSITLACGCSCCCCCCLHTVGGLALAGVGTRTPTALRASKTEEQNESRSSAKKFYWLSLLFVSALVPGTILAAETPHDIEDFLLVVGMIVLMALPLVQLGASLASHVLIAIMPSTVIPVKGEAHRAVLRITLWSLLGAFIGIVLLVPIGMLVLA